MSNDFASDPAQIKREQARLRKQEQRRRNKANNVVREKAVEKIVSYPAKEKENAKSAKAIIAGAWGITREHVINTVYAWGVRAAEQLKVPQSDFFWSNGPLAILKSVQAAEEGETHPTPKLSIEDSNIVKGEVTYRRELYALYIFAEQWRSEISEDAIPSFDAYLAERYECKTGGTINRGNKYFGMDFHEKPHSRWDDLYLRWNPDLLEPDYDREDMKEWLGSLSEDKKRLLIACRSAYKSTFSLCFLVGGILCCPDIRLLFVTETKPLSLEFLKAFVYFFEIKNPNEPSRFNRLFAEYCVAVDDSSSLKFQSPMSILGLPQPTCKTTSMESGGWAGNRSDYILVSDAISSNTVGTPDQIQKSVNNVGAITELLEVGGYLHLEGTPWHENDLYAQLLERNERADGKNLLFIIDPAWTVKESGEGKAVQDLLEEDVELLFPARLTWKVLQAKLQDDDPPYRRFRMQSLCQFLPEVEETQKLHFRRDDLTRNSTRYENVPIGGRIVASSDLAFSKSRYADLSCFTIMSVIEGRMYVLEQVSGHFNDTEKAKLIVELYMKHSGLDTWLIEKYPSSENLNEAIRKEATKFGVTVPVRWAPVDNKADAKFHRLKGIESVIGQNRIRFVFGYPGTSSTWIDDLFNELETLDDTTPKRRSSTRKDDRGDSLSLGVKYFLPADEDEESQAERLKREEEQLQVEQRARHYRAMFGTGIGQDYEARPSIPQDDFAQSSPVHQALGRGGFTKTPVKQLSFNSAPRVFKR